MRSIRAKKDGFRLGADEMTRIVKDIVAGRFSRIEVSVYLTTFHINGMNVDEISAYARAMAVSSGTLTLETGSRSSTFTALEGSPAIGSHRSSSISPRRED